MVVQNLPFEESYLFKYSNKCMLKKYDGCV
jgi:hypothetical protein